MTRNLVLWTVQVLLAALFVFAGGMKLVLPIEAMTGAIALPGALLRFVGLAELAGGLGLLLPGMTGIRRDLTPLAAVGLVIIMTGATVITVLSGSIPGALFPLVVGVLCASIAHGRASWTRRSAAGRSVQGRVATA